MAVAWKKVVIESAADTITQNTTGNAAGLSATLALTSGGTGLTSVPKGSLIHTTSDNTFAALSGGTGDNGKVVSYNESSDVFQLIDTGTATNATNVAVTDNENTNEENVITFVAGAAGSGNVGLEADGDFTYNPSSGTVSATIFKGNIDAVDGDFDGTLEADAITVGGTALATVIAGTTVTNATNSAHVLITDNESTAEENLIAFVEGAANTTGNHGLEMDGNLTYNPSTGTLTSTVFKAQNGDFDGTLEADAITVNGTALSSVIAGTTVANATNAVNADNVATTATSADSQHFLALVNSATGDNALLTDTGLRFNPSNDTLQVTNLTVSGTSTIINTTNLEVTDKLIRVANNGSNASTVDVAGMEIDTENGTQLPFVGFHDGAALTEMIVRKEGNTTDFPIAVMRHDANAPDANTVNAGKGTMYYDTANNELYLQVNV